jgi:hypothetical protein
MQRVLQAAIPTAQRLALEKNVASIRAQCKHSTMRENGKEERKLVTRSTKKSEAASSSLYAASVFAIGGAIGVAVLLL